MRSDARGADVFSFRNPHPSWPFTDTNLKFLGHPIPPSLLLPCVDGFRAEDGIAGQDGHLRGDAHSRAHRGGAVPPAYQLLRGITVVIRTKYGV